MDAPQQGPPITLDAEVYIDVQSTPSTPTFTPRCALSDLRSKVTLSPGHSTTTKNFPDFPELPLRQVRNV